MKKDRNCGMMPYPVYPAMPVPNMMPMYQGQFAYDAASATPYPKISLLSILI